jgi:hypothetical protein
MANRCAWSWSTSKPYACPRVRFDGAAAMASAEPRVLVRPRWPCIVLVTGAAIFCALLSSRCARWIGATAPAQSLADSACPKETNCASPSKSSSVGTRQTAGICCPGYGTGATSMPATRALAARGCGASPTLARGACCGPGERGSGGNPRSPRALWIIPADLP